MFQSDNQQQKSKPTHTVKVRHGAGDNARYEQIGVAWASTENGTAYVKLNGVQIVQGGFTLYPIE